VVTTSTGSYSFNSIWVTASTQKKCSQNVVFRIDLKKKIFQPKLFLPTWTQMDLKEYDSVDVVTDPGDD
jgi:hypothetical protein